MYMFARRRDAFARSLNPILAVYDTQIELGPGG